jgi:hypothetical protein
MRFFQFRPTNVPRVAIRISRDSELIVTQKDLPAQIWLINVPQESSRL